MSGAKSYKPAADKEKNCGFSNMKNDDHLWKIIGRRKTIIKLKTDPMEINNGV